MKFFKKIPPTDKELSIFLVSDGWRLIIEPSNFALAILCSIPLMVVNGVLAYILIMPYYNPIQRIIENASISFEMNIFDMLYGLIIFSLILITHEFFHAIFIPNFISSNKTFWGFNINGGFVGTSEKIRKDNFILISMAPYILISLVMPLILGSLGFMNGFVFFLIIFNAMASSVDVLSMILILFQVPRKSLITANGFETYYK